MKALRVGKADGGGTTVAVEDIPKPTPKDGEVLVKIKASTVMPADILNSKGGFPATTFPRTIGKDFAGTVVQGPPELEGRDVFGTSGNTFGFTVDGAQAEYAVVPVDSVALMPSENLTYIQASALGTPWTTANLTLQRAQAKRGETVMVLGATGQVGGAVVQLAKALYGCKTISVGRHGTDVDSTKDPELKTARDLSDGKGPDVVVDTVGDFALTRAAIKVLAPDGRISFISAPRSGGTVLDVDILDLYRRQICLVGCNTAKYSQQDMTATLKELAPLFGEGKLKGPDPKSLTRLSIGQAADAYNGKVKKAVLVFDE